MIPLSNKFPEDGISILWGVPIPIEIRWEITTSVRSPVIWRHEFRDDYLFEEIENHIDRLEYYWSSRNETTILSS